MGGIINILIYCAIAFGATLTLVGLAPFALIVLLTFMGATGRAEKAFERLSSTLMESEVLQAEAIQHRVFALFKRRALVGITNSRVIMIQRGILGGFRMLDIQWKDLEDVRIEENVLAYLCGSNLQFKHGNASVSQLTISGVPSETATVIYSKAQSQEQAWEEKRRVRRMEEVRAAAGGVTVNTPAQQASPSLIGGNRMLEEITKAKGMLDAGIINDAEFQEMKSKILAAT